MRYQQAYARRQRAVTFTRSSTRTVTIPLETADFERLERLAIKTQCRQRYTRPPDYSQISQEGRCRTGFKRLNRLASARVARKDSLSCCPSLVHGPRRIAGSNTPRLPSRAVKPARVRNVPAIPGARSALRRPPIRPDERRLRQMMASKRQCSLFRPPQLGDSNLLPNSNRIDLPEGPLSSAPRPGFPH